MTPQPASAVQRAPSAEFHNLCNAAQLTPRMQVVYERIARRACELAQALAHKERYTQEDWAQAESEWLRPVPVEIETYADKITVRAAVLGFDDFLGWNFRHAQHLFRSDLSNGHGYPEVVQSFLFLRINADMRVRQRRDGGARRGSLPGPM